MALSFEEVTRYVQAIRKELKNKFPDIYRRTLLYADTNRGTPFILLKVLSRDRARQFTTALSTLHILRLISLNMKPPKKIRTQAPVQGFGILSVFLPHNYYRVNMSKGMSRLMIGSTTLLVPKNRLSTFKKDILKILKKHAKKQPYIVMNGVEESLGSIYFLHKYMGNPDNLTAIRSLHLNGQELDLVTLPDKGPLHVVEVLSAYKDDTTFWEDKLRKKEQKLNFVLRRIPIPWELHYVLVGDEKSLDAAMLAANSILKNRTVHAISIDGFEPIKVKRF